MMRRFALYLVFLTIGFYSLSVIAAPSVSHQHNGRTHSHSLPKTGVKHFHKHMHNGRAHIHPYSEKVGFKHTHNKSPRARAWANAVNHDHGGKSHTHPLPRSGIKHNHRHRHGGRTHIHPLPVSGVNHFHQLNKKASNQITQQPAPTRMIKGLSIRQQIDAVLGRPIRNTPKPVRKLQKVAVQRKANTQKTNNINHAYKRAQALIRKQQQANRVRAASPQKTTPVMNQNTIRKVLGIHQHDGRTHQHLLPNNGTLHAHKHAHAGKIHSHTIPASRTAHIHKKAKPNPQFKTKRKTITRKAIAKKTIAKQARRINKAKAPVTRPVAVKKVEQQKNQTPQEKLEGNRQFSLALRYENGTGVKKNLPQAFNWYLRAAKNGNAKAQFNLASLYENGEGTKPNIQQAIHWYTTAANSGNTNAQVNLGNRYAEGRGVARNINEAARWYKRAADQGDLRGRANLNYLIEDNNGVIKR